MANKKDDNIKNKKNDTAKKKTTSKSKVTNKKTTPTKKAAAKKTTNKKVVKEENVIKKEIPQKENFFKSTKFLTIIFISLLVLVVVLGVLVGVKKKEDSSTLKANIILSLVDEKDSFDFGINAKELSEAKVYSFKVANYREKINKKEINYSVTIKNNTDSEISITKNNSNENLMKDQKNTLIENNSLIKNKKYYDYYIITMNKSGKLKDKEFIYVNVKANK